MRDLAAAIRAENERIFAEKYCFMEEQKIKKALAPQQWDELCAALDEEGRRINALAARDLVSCERPYPDSATVRNLSDGRTVTLRYDPDVPCIHYEIPGGKKGHLGFRVAFDGTSVQIMDGRYPKRIAEVAQDIFMRAVRRG